MKAHVISAPSSLRSLAIQGRQNRIVFLAGSIEMGTAEKWQDQVIARLSDIPCNILNPRRTDWDSSWVQDKNNPQFREQVEWELDGLDMADIIALYFDPNTKSPISLLELGLYVERKIIIYCPQPFWRKGNVDIVADRWGIPVFEDRNEFLDTLIRVIKQ